MEQYRKCGDEASWRAALLNWVVQRGGIEPPDPGPIPPDKKFRPDLSCGPGERRAPSTADEITEDQKAIAEIKERYAQPGFK